MKSKASTPIPGRSVRGSRSGRPLMAALDLFGRRGTLRILWELRGATLTFRALQDAAETNPALLNTRLRELREAALAAHVGDGYALTPVGLALLQALEPLSKWAARWAKAASAPEASTRKHRAKPRASP